MKRVQDFETLYRKNPDPWDYQTSPYERAKYLATLRLVPRRFYGRALELGCSIGVLSQMLATRCQSLVAVDASPTAVGKARERRIPNARFVVGVMPRDIPKQRFDLIVASEFIYYLNAAQLRRLGRILRCTSPGADCVLVSFTGRSNAPLSGRDATRIFLREMGAPEHVAGQGKGRFVTATLKIPALGS